MTDYDYGYKAGSDDSLKPAYLRRDLRGIPFDDVWLKGYIDGFKDFSNGLVLTDTVSAYDELI